MPITSYLAHAMKGQKEVLINQLSGLENCEIIPAENQDIVVVVTETEDTIQEDILKEQIEAFASLKLLALVSGFNTPKND
jgi:nitrate reductase NapAB chaperone NapD